MINPNISLDIGLKGIPLCERCGHRKVCQYEGAYRALFRDLDKLSKNVNIDFFHIELKCKEIIPKYTVHEKLGFCERSAGYDFTETTDKSTP